MKYQPIDFKKVGLNIRAERSRQGYTMEELAEKCGMAYPTISKAELGSAKMFMTTLDKIAKALDTNIEQLLKMER